MSLPTLFSQSIDLQALPTHIWSVLTKANYTRQYFFECLLQSDWLNGNSIQAFKETNGPCQLCMSGKVHESIPGIHLHFSMMEHETSNHYELIYDLFPSSSCIELKLKVSSSISEKEFWTLMLLKIKWLAEYS